MAMIDAIANSTQSVEPKSIGTGTGSGTHPADLHVPKGRPLAPKIVPVPYANATPGKCLVRLESWFSQCPGAADLSRLGGPIAVV
jgi:hypothetical protein